MIYGQNTYGHEIDWDLSSSRWNIQSTRLPKDQNGLMRTFSNAADKAGTFIAGLGIGFDPIEKVLNRGPLGLTISDTSIYSAMVLQNGGRPIPWLSSTSIDLDVSLGARGSSYLIDIAKAAKPLKYTGFGLGIVGSALEAVTMHWDDPLDVTHFTFGTSLTVGSFFISKLSPVGWGWSVADLAISNFHYIPQGQSKPVYGWRAFLGLPGPSEGSDPRWQTQPEVMIGK